MLAAFSATVSARAEHEIDPSRAVLWGPPIFKTGRGADGIDPDP